MQTKVKAETSEEKLRSILRKQFFVVAGLSQEELEKMDVTSMSDEELKNIMKKRLFGVQATNGSKQKVVSVGEANDYLTKDWEYVANQCTPQPSVRCARATRTVI